MTYNDEEGNCAPRGESPPARTQTGTPDGRNHESIQENDAPSVDGSKVKIPNIGDIPEVQTYLRRVGAEVRSMFTAVIMERDGKYKRDIATIRLARDTGAITVTSESDGLDPTDFEAAAIANAVKSVRWPERKLLRSLINLPAELRVASPDDLIEFHDADDNIVMVQQRVSRADGTKEYKPWTYFDDDQWRCMEPEGPLPMWGIPHLKGQSAAFLHEGAKAARIVQRMVEARDFNSRKELADHPWGAELQNVAHVGWIGGAPSPHRTDWSELLKAGIERVIIVADNDRQGVDAVRAISKLLGAYPISVAVLRFDDRFPPAFDLGDAFPDEMFATSLHGRRAYKGPSFSDCLLPATWATRVGKAPPPTGKGRPPSPPVMLRREFAREWCLVASEGKPFFVNHHDRSKLYSQEAFDTLVRALSDVRQTSELFKATAYSSIVQALAYNPGDKEGVIHLEGELCVNTWTRSRIEPGPGSAEPFLIYMRGTFPVEEECHEILKWCATLIARPRIRMKYGLLLASQMQGVGKTTLCEVLRVLVGEKNCRSPSVKDVVESAFNSWIVRKRLVFVNEIYEGKSWAAYHKMKSFITDQTLEANEKMVKGYSIANWAHFILCSNASVPLWLEEDDRRFLVPTVTEEKRPKSYWAELYDWLEAGGYGAIARWAGDFIEEHGAVHPSDEAPTSERKRELIEDSRCVEERMVLDLAAAAKALAEKQGRQVIFVETEVVAWLKSRTAKDWRPNLVRRWLKAGGLHISANRLKVRGRSTKVAGVRAINASVGWPDLEPNEVKPLELEAL